MIQRALSFLVCCAALSAATLTPVDEAGYTRLVAAHKGKVLLVNFWATYCIPCRKEIPEFLAMQQRLQARGFQLVTISADEPEQETAAGSFLDKNKVPAPTYIRRAKDDDKFIGAIDKKWSGALPASFLYDRQGNKVKSFIGEVDIKTLEAAITRLL